MLVAGVRSGVAVPVVIPEVLASSRDAVEPTSTYTSTDMFGDVVDMELSDVITVSSFHAFWTANTHNHNSPQPLAAGDFDRLPRTRTTLGDRSFTAAGPHLWNNLPLHLRDFELSLSKFRRLLNTHLFG